MKIDTRILAIILKRLFSCIINAPDRIKEMYIYVE